MRAQGYGSPDQIVAGAEAQSDWDPSVKALTAFPDVLDMLNHNLEWTTDLGNAIQPAAGRDADRPGVRSAPSRPAICKPRRRKT